MVHSSLFDELALAPSANWAALIKRHDLVSNYIQISHPSADDINSYARHAGISPRMFYRLVRKHRAREQGASAPTKIVGRGKPLCKTQEDAIAAAIHAAGVGASTKEVVAAVRLASESFGVPPPSEYAIIDRLRSGRDLAGLNAKLAHAFDWILDACSLDIQIDCGGDRFEAASIVGLINLRSGKLERHQIVIGAFGATDFADLGKKMCSSKASPDTLDELAVTRTAWGPVTKAFSTLSARAVRFVPCPPNTIRSGGALRSIFGQRLGGIRLLSRRYARADANRSVGVPSYIVSAVVARLIEQWNYNVEDTAN